MDELLKLVSMEIVALIASGIMFLARWLIARINGLPRLQKWGVSYAVNYGLVMLSGYIGQDIPNLEALMAPGVAEAAATTLLTAGSWQGVKAWLKNKNRYNLKNGKLSVGKG